MFRKVRIVLFLAAVPFLASAQQALTGTITGSITDPSEAAIPFDQRANGKVQLRRGNGRVYGGDQFRDVRQPDAGQPDSASLGEDRVLNELAGREYHTRPALGSGPDRFPCA